jgi:hypothetical protein
MPVLAAKMLSTFIQIIEIHSKYVHHTAPELTAHNLDTDNLYEMTFPT